MNLKYNIALWLLLFLSVAMQGQNQAYFYYYKGGGCTTDLTLSGIINNAQNYKAASSISATQVMTSTANVNYKAGLSITLAAGFSANSGADFRAFIADCGSDFSKENSKIVHNYQDEQSDLYTEILSTENATRQVQEPIGNIELSAYPNPFTQNTTIEYTLHQASPVTLSISDLTGRQVRQLVNKEQLAGQHLATFDAQELPAGMYLARLQVNGTIHTIKLMVMHP